MNAKSGENNYIQQKNRKGEGIPATAQSKQSNQAPRVGPKFLAFEISIDLFHQNSIRRQWTSRPFGKINNIIFTFIII